MLALAGMAQSVDGVAGGFVLDAVITALGPGHAAVGEDDARPERSVFQALFDKAACGGLFKVIAHFALRQAQGTALEGGQAPGSRGQGKSHCVTDFGHGNGA